MPRAILLVVACTLLAACVAAVLAGWPLIPLALFSALLVFGLLFERYVYKPIRTDPPGPGWQRTMEQFTDPESGQSVTVYFNPRTGERRYVAGGSG